MTDRILLVGATGRVGQLVTASWARGSPTSLQFVRQVRRGVAPDSPNQLSWDPMAGSDALVDWVKTYGEIGTMIVLAGITPRSGQSLSLNATIAQFCLAAAKDAEIPRILVASSSAVYGVGDGQPFAETSPCKPVNLYGIAKLEMERVCADWKQSGMDVSCLRIGNVAGADALLLNLTDADTRMPLLIDIFDDDKGPIRSYIGPRSLANVLAALARSSTSPPTIINIAAPRPIAMEDLAISAECRWKPRPAADNSTQRIILDCSLLSRFYSFAPDESRPEEMVCQWKDVLRG